MKSYIISEVEIRAIENHLQLISIAARLGGHSSFDWILEILNNVRDKDIPVAISSSTSERNQTEEELQFLASED